MTRPLSERFNEKVDRSGGPDACWLWTGWRHPQGYGYITRGGRRGPLLRSNRAAWELANGPIPDGMNVLHKCDNPPCCNPAHLFLGTQQDNVSDMVSKGRYRGGAHLAGDLNPSRVHPERVARGERVGCARLTEANVLAIRSSTESQRVLARRFGVDRRTISFVRSGRTWRHLLPAGET